MGDAEIKENRLREAQKAHERGWVLTPLCGKVPTKRGWTTAPPPSTAVLVRWARDGNLGLRTGRVSGVVVVDDDTPDGSVAAALKLPTTVSVTTGSGKRHYYFRAPAGGLANSVSKIAAGVDVRGDGGQVVYPGSIHPDTKAPYVWTPGLSPEEIALAEFPEHLLPRAASGSSSQPRRAGAHGRRSAGRQAAAVCLLQKEADKLASTPPGERNDALNRAAFQAGRLIGSGDLHRDQAESVLREPASRSGLEPGEIEATLRSGLDAGEKNPWTWNAGSTRTGAGPEAGIQSPPRRTSIQITGGELPANVDQAEDVLLRASQPLIFQRQGLLVRPVRLDGGSNASGVRRQPGSLVLSLVDAPYLIDLFTRLIHFQKLDGRSNELKAINCPKEVAETYLARKGEWKVPVLEGVIEAPTLREDGSILDQPGYDVRSQLLFDPGEVIFDPIPAQPSREEAAAALHQLREILPGFPFVAASDCATALAAILTAPVRRSLPTAPMFVVRAPTMGSGKSLLVDVVAMVATGRPAAVMSQGKDEDEERKRYFALLLEGEPVISIDNIERPLKGDALCSVLTQRVYKDRVLGRSGTASVPTTSTFFATGNNLLPQGDLVSRVVVCDLDAGCERPEERTFDVDLYRLVPEQRHRLVPAALTVLRAYQVAGCPDQGLVPFGRFERWSKWVRSALVWMGEADACAGRSRVAETDPERETLVAVLEAWQEAFGEKPVTAKDLAEATARKLREAILQVASRRDGSLDPRQLGHWLNHRAGRIEQGLRIQRVGKRHGSALWRVKATASGGGGSVGSEGLSQPFVGNCQSDTSHIGLGNIPHFPHFPPLAGSGDEETAEGRSPEEGEAAEGGEAA